MREDARKSQRSTPASAGLRPGLGRPAELGGVAELSPVAVGLGPSRMSPLYGVKMKATGHFSQLTQSENPGHLCFLIGGLEVSEGVIFNPTGAKWRKEKRQMGAGGWN